MKLYGCLAEFKSAEALLHAARSARATGYRHVEAYTPFPVEGLVEIVGSYRDRVPLITLLGGVFGGAGGYFLQWYSAVVNYPMNLGGRPYHSWPAFIPITFELTVLGASLAAVFGMLALNGLPRLYHPLFNAPVFELASRNRFFLCLRTGRDDDTDEMMRFLSSLEPVSVHEVPL